MEKKSLGNLTLQRVQEKVEADRRIKSESIAKRKRTIFIRRIVAISFLMVGLFTIGSFASGLLDNNEQVKEQKVSSFDKAVAEYDKVEVLVEEGDSAWTIQKKLTPGEDLRDVLFLVQKINKRDTLDDVKYGEVLTFLKAK